MSRKLKDVHIQMSEAHHEELKQKALKRGIYSLSTFCRTVLIEALELADESAEATAADVENEPQTEPAD